MSNKNITSGNMSFGQRLKSARKSKGLTLKIISKAIGVTHGFLSDVENGKKSLGLEKLLSLPVILNIDFHWLFTGEGEMFGTKNTTPKEPGLDPDETVLLDRFRSLNEKAKVELLGYASCLLVHFSAVEPKKKQNHG